TKTFRFELVRVQTSPHLPPATPFRTILDLRFLNRLPLLVRRNIQTARFQWNDVIDDVTLPTFRISRLLHKVRFAVELRAMRPLLSRGGTVDWWESFGAGVAFTFGDLVELERDDEELDFVDA